MDLINTIGFGGSCHWCTEAIFQSLNGVMKVEQGWISSDTDATGFSEAVIVHFDRAVISLETLIAIHLYTHSCTSEHSMRSKYRSAIYTFKDEQTKTSKAAIEFLQNEFENPIITRVVPFRDFKLNEETYLNYYFKNPQKPFCENIINPKLRLVLQKFSGAVDRNKLTEDFKS